MSQGGCGPRGVHWDLWGTQEAAPTPWAPRAGREQLWPGPARPLRWVLAVWSPVAGGLWESSVSIQVD